MKKPQMRIIDHKKVLITDDEFSLYQSICREYDRPNFKGESLFVDHFESDDDGIIVLVKPPNKRYSSLEVFTFLISLEVNQHVRIAREQCDMMVKEATKLYTSKLAELEAKNEELQAKLDDKFKTLVKNSSVEGACT